MPKYKVLKSPPGRWGEGYQEGEIAGMQPYRFTKEDEKIEMDENAARVPVEKGELESYTDEKKTVSTESVNIAGVEPVSEQPAPKRRGRPPVKK